ncbi:hypothetical protein NBRC116594_23030 [Shimia sp. NS0008-38b]|uniref:PAS domain-containing hybrid sensor histidine kinase/response regulator n=1 Tax=Shimia sp. NS0008-38b TaxID=3127653 RepID=UPI0031097D79
MAAEIHELNRALKEFDARNTAAGRLERYARGRLRHAMSRQLFVGLGAFVLAFVVSPAVGALALSFVVIGEIVDFCVLRPIPEKIHQGESLRNLRVKSTLSATLQAIGLSLFVATIWYYVPREAGLMLTIAFLVTAAINAVMTLGFHKAAATARLLVFGVALVSLFVTDYFVSQYDRIQFFYNAAVTLMVVYTLLPFVHYVTNGRMRDLQQQRRQIEQALELARVNATLLAREREGRRLASIPENAVDSIFMLDKDARILWANPAFTTQTGYTLPEVVGQQPADLLYGPHSDRRAQDALLKEVLQGKPSHRENINYTKDGTSFWVETSVAPVFDENGDLETCIAIERNISEKKQQARELAAAKQAAEMGERAKSIFLANMSHEIRTPMNGIIGMAELLSDAKLGEEESLYVQTIRHSSEALLTIINDILDYSKLKDGHIKITPARFDLHECLTEVMNLMRPQADAKGIALTLATSPDLPETPWGDEGRLRQILVNVIGNAVKFTEIGGVHIKVAVPPSGSGILIDVIDTGVGIPPHRLTNIFEQFEQADAATTRQFGGTGLGLAIARQLARLMGGDVSVTSTPGQGSCFSIQVPFLAADAHSPEEPDAMESPPQALFENVTVLLAEDNRTNRLLVEKMLKGLPLTLVSAEDGAEAVLKAQELEPEVVLMDMSMPVLDGLDATREIRALSMRQPNIIAITANAYLSDREACLAAGMDGFLSKPVRRAELIQALTRALGDHKSLVNIDI